MPSASGGRSSIKSDSRLSRKDQLRKECFSRLEAGRFVLLERARQTRKGQGLLKEALRDIIWASSAHIECDKNGETLSMDGVLEASGIGGVATPPRAPGPLNGAEPFGNNNDGLAAPPCRSPEIDTLSAEDYQELMQTLEEALYQDILREEAEYLDSLEKQDLESTLENFLDRGTSPPGQGPVVRCPLCREAYLVQHQGVILCPRRHLRVDTSIEGIGLEDVRQRLAAAFEIHSHRCRCQPFFEQQGIMGTNSLLMKCDSCGMLEVVL